MANGDPPHVEGLAALRQAMLAFAPKVRKRLLAQAVGATGAAGVVRAAAIAEAPFYHEKVGRDHPPPGTLKKSIVAKQLTQESNDQRLYYGVKPLAKLGAYYWWHVEFGTSKMAAHPFMRPALQNNAQAAVDKMSQKLKAGVAALNLKGPA